MSASSSPSDPGPGEHRFGQSVHLAGAVLGLWAALLAAQLLAPAPRLLILGGGLTLVGALAAAMRGDSRWATPGWIMTGLALGAVVAGGYAIRCDPPALEPAVRSAAAASATVRITSDPMPVSGRNGPTYRVNGAATLLTTRGQVVRGRIPVLLLGRGLGHLEYGSVIAVNGRLGEPRAGSPATAVLLVAGEPELRSPPGRLAGLTNRVRASLGGAVSGLGQAQAALILGLAIGDESELDESLRAAMLRAGLSHLTAVSGANTTMVLGLAIGLAALLGLGWRARVIVAAVVLAGFVAVVRPQPSVLRAAAMGCVTLLVVAGGGRRNGLRALIASVGGLLLISPTLATSIGLALSVAATAGLLTLAAPMARAATSSWGRWLPPPVLTGLTVTAAATLATLPLTVGLGNGFSLVSLPANLLVMPLVPPVTVLGLAAAVAGLGVPAVARVLTLLAAPFAGGIAAVATWAADVPGAVIPLPGGWPFAVVCTGVLAVAVIALRTRLAGTTARRAAAATLAAAVLVWFVTAAVLEAASRRRWPPPDWLAVSCDVGQGDATVIRVPGPGPPLGVLVDAGPDPAVLVRCLRRLRLAGVAAVVLTHSHADHVGGIAAVEQLWPETWPRIPVITSARASALESAAVDLPEPTRSQPVAAGAQLLVPGVRMDFLWPARAIVESPENNASLVAVVTVQADPPLRMLLAGDVESEAQVAVMAATGRLVVDVLKVPHHGSPNQASGFAAWTHARVALLSVGADNDYGHPAPTTVADLQARKMLIGRTDEQGGLALVRRDGVLGLVVER